jgi:transcriptional regulator GlxA family with amidase domain
MGIVLFYPIGWANFASDYSRYFPAETNWKKIVLAAGCGQFVALMFCEVIGVLFATALGGTLGEDPVSQLSRFLPTWFIVPLLFAIILGGIAANVPNGYTAGLGLLALRIPINRVTSLAVIALFTLAFRVVTVFYGEFFGMYSGSTVSDAGLQFIRRSAESSATVVGVCTGAFALAQAGVMDGHRICVSWFHYWDFQSRFPDISEALLVADRLFVINGRRITCSGGRASIDVAAAILQQHIDAAVVQKALRILLVNDAGRTNAPPHPPGSEPSIHPRLRRAVHLIEQHIGAPLSVEALATRLHTSPRQLQRLFKEETGESPLAYALRIRLKTAAWLLAGTHRTVSDIAGHCGFFDASHMGRQFRPSMV